MIREALIAAAVIAVYLLLGGLYAYVRGGFR